jgi:hypothetical protein
LVAKSTGDVFLTITEYAYLGFRPFENIERRMREYAKNHHVPMTSILTMRGVASIVLIPVSLAEKWLPGDNPKLAKRLTAEEADLSSYLKAQAGI